MVRCRYPTRDFAEPASHGGPDAGPTRAISNNGAYVFFDSGDPLVPAAENKTQDVFEWEAQGTGGCEQLEGCVHLIGSGNDNSPSFFLGMSSYVNSSGETVEAGNVFFGTTARLVPQDTDEEGDVYDARIDGGFPEPAGKGPCKGNACESPTPAPVDPTPASLAPPARRTSRPAPLPRPNRQEDHEEDDPAVQAGLRQEEGQAEDRVCQIQEGDEVVQAEGAVAMRNSAKLPLFVLSCPAAVSRAFVLPPALAAEGGPQWAVTAVSAPTNFRPGSVGEADYRITVTNTGGSSSDGEPVTISDELPEGLALDPAGASGEDLYALYHSEGSGASKFKCVLWTCTYTGTVVPEDTLILTVPVDVGGRGIVCHERGACVWWWRAGCVGEHRNDDLASACWFWRVAGEREHVVVEHAGGRASGYHDDDRVQHAEHDRFDGGRCEGCHHRRATGFRGRSGGYADVRTRPVQRGCGRVSDRYADRGDDDHVRGHQKQFLPGGNRACV